MYRTPPIVLTILLAALCLSDCSSQLKMVSEDDSSYLKGLRREYIAANPDGMYNDLVVRGEVVRGMDFLAVLASWGHPQKRERRSDTSEYWVYREVDKDSKDWVEYWFSFRHNVLDDWELSRHFASGGILDLKRSGDTSLSKTSPPPGKRVPD